MAKTVEKWLTKRGWEVHLQPVPPQKDCNIHKERYNVYAVRPGVKDPLLLFNTHLDTVPPYFPARIDDKNIYGRGAGDTKSLLAAQLIAANNLVKINKFYEEKIGLLFVVSEETDHSGMKLANELKLNPKHMIVGEPTGMRLIKMQKGILKAKLIRHGVAAHSGYPHLGDSAIDPLIAVLHDLKNEEWSSDPELGETTLNVGTIEGGQAANALAEYASAMIMFRVIEDPEKVFKRLKEIVNKRVEVELYTSNAPVKLGTLENYPLDVASFNTDIPYFKFGSRHGQAYLIGAGKITDCHCPREYVPLNELKHLVEVYSNIAKELLGEE